MRMGLPTSASSRTGKYGSLPGKEVATARAHVERVVLERFDAFFAAKGGG